MTTSFNPFTDVWTLLHDTLDPPELSISVTKALPAAGEAVVTATSLAVPTSGVWGVALSNATEKVRLYLGEYLANAPGSAIQTPVLTAPVTLALALTEKDPVPSFGISALGRGFYDDDGEPLYLFTDTPWHLITRCTQSEIRDYVAARKAQGFNTLQVVALSIYPDVEPVHTKANIYGKYPFFGNEAPDITQPLRTGGVTSDDTSPDYDYWDHVRWAVRYIGEQGMYINIVPMWLGYQGSSWRGYYYDASVPVYGAFLGNLLGDLPHVIWMLGGDNDPVGNVTQVPAGLFTGDVVTAVNNMAAAITAECARPPLMTFHTNRQQSAGQRFFGQPWFNVYAAYSDRWTWDYVENEVESVPAAPTHLVEAYYDGRPAAGLSTPHPTREELRAELYWSFLSGAAGAAYAHEFTCRMLPGWEAYVWVPSSSDIALLRQTIERLGKDPIADTRTSTNAMLATGRGDGAVNVASVAASAVRKDRTYGVAYFLETRTPISVNLARFNKTTVVLKWVNPGTGEQVAIGTYGGTGTQAVTYPPTFSDALLIAEASGTDVVVPDVKALTDQFDGVSTASWIEHDPDNVTAFSNTGGKLRAVISGTGTYDLSSTVSNAPKWLQLHKGDFDVTVRSDTVVTGSTAPQTFRGWNIVAMAGPTGDCMFLSTYDTTTLTQRINFARRVGTTITNFYNTTPGGGVPATLVLRLRRIGDVFTAYFGSSPYNVTSLGSQTWTGASTMTHLGIAVVTGGATWTADFEYFSVDGSYTAPPAPGLLAETSPGTAITASYSLDEQTWTSVPTSLEMVELPTHAEIFYEQFSLAASTSASFGKFRALPGRLALPPPTHGQTFLPLGTSPDLQPPALTPTQMAVIHALVGAQFGDLEFDVGKSVRWTQWYVDDVFITDVNYGTQRYWIIDWTKSFPEVNFKTAGGLSYFTDPIAFRKKQFADAEQFAREDPYSLVFDNDDWVLWVDAHEGLSVDNTAPYPNDYDFDLFRSYVVREIEAANAAGRDTIRLPFYAYVRHDNIQNVQYDWEPNQPEGGPKVTQNMGVPYYIPQHGLVRLTKVSALRNPAFNWASIDQPQVFSEVGGEGLEEPYYNPTVGFVTMPDPGPMPREFTFVFKTLGPTPAGDNCIAGQTTGAVTQHSWALYAQGNVIRFMASPLGEVAGDVTRSLTGPALTGEPETKAVTVNTATGALRLLKHDGTAWQQVATDTGPPTYPFDTNLPIGIGHTGVTGTPYRDRIYSVELRTGLDPAVGGSSVWTPGYLNFPRNVTGNSVRAIITHPVDASGSCRIECEVSPFDGQTHAPMGDAMWLLYTPYLGVNGVFGYVYDTAGLPQGVSVTMAVANASGVPNTGKWQFKVNWNAATDTVSLHHRAPGPDLMDDSVAWTQLAFLVVAGMQMRNGAAQQNVGSQGGIGYGSGPVWRLVAEANGVITADFDFRYLRSLPGSTMVLPSGQTATVQKNGTTPLTVSPMVDGLVWKFDAKEVPALPANTTGAYVRLPGLSNNFLATPDPAVLFGATQLDLRWIERAPLNGVAGYTGVNGVIAGQSASTTFTAFVVAGTNEVSLGAGNVTTLSRAIRPTTGVAACRVTWRSSDGRVQMFTKNTADVTAMLDNAGWTQVGANATAGLVPMIQRVETMTIGAYYNGVTPAFINLVAMSFSTTIDGTPFAMWDTAQQLKGQQVDPYGSSWMLTGAATWHAASDLMIPNTFTDPRGRVWTMTAPGGVIPYDQPETRIQVVSYGYAHWNLQDIPPGHTGVPDINAENDMGWRQRNLLSQVRPIPGLPYGETWQFPDADNQGVAGPWALQTFEDQVTGVIVPEPRPPIDPAVAGVRTPLYDTVLRLNMRDGVWYSGDGEGNTPLDWDDVTQQWVPAVPSSVTDIGT